MHPSRKHLGSLTCEALRICHAGDALEDDQTCEEDGSGAQRTGHSRSSPRGVGLDLIFWSGSKFSDETLKLLYRYIIEGEMIQHQTQGHLRWAGVEKPGRVSVYLVWCWMQTVVVLTAWWRVVYR